MNKGEEESVLLQLPTATVERATAFHYWPWDKTCLLTLPYLACQAKKYSSAPSGWPTRQKLSQKTQLPIIFPAWPFILSKGSVAAIRGSCSIIPAKATPGTS